VSLHFAGGTDTVRYGGSGYSSPGTIAFRMKTTQVTANVALASIWTSGSRQGLGVLLNNTAGKATAVGYAASAQQVNLTSTTSVNDGNWHHVAFNFNTTSGAGNSLYIDGVSEATGNSAGAWFFANAGNSPLVVGDNNDTFWATYVGDIAELALWLGRQLVADELAALSKGFSPSLIAPNVLATYMPFVRSANNLKDSFIMGPTGTSFSDHPRVIGP
jgi:hypothetical protein